MKKWLLSICIVLALTACDNKKEATQINRKQTVIIGAILPLTGSQAILGAAARAGMQKALKEKSHSDLHYNYQLVFEDNQAKLSSMPAIANKMIMQDNIDVIGTTPSAMAKVIAPITDQKAKVLYSYSFEQENYQPFGKYVFTQGISIEAINDTSLKHFIKNNINNVSAFIENIGILGPLMTHLKENLSEKVIRYQINEFNPGEVDFRLAIEKAKTEGYTTFLVAGFPPEKNILLKQMLEAGIETKNILGLGLDMNKLPEQYNEIKTVTYDSGSDDFVKSIQTEYNLDSTFGSANFYDFISLMIEAYEALYKEGQKPTAEEITVYIYNKREFSCMSGQCVVHPNGFIMNDPIVRTYKDGQWVKIEE